MLCKWSYLPVVCFYFSDDDDGDVLLDNAAAVKLSFTPSNAAFRAKLTKLSVHDKDDDAIPPLVLWLAESVAALAVVDVVGNDVDDEETIKEDGAD